MKWRLNPWRLVAFLAIGLAYAIAMGLIRWPNLAVKLVMPFLGGLGVGSVCCLLLRPVEYR